MKIIKSFKNTALTIALEGRLDTTTAPELETELNASMSKADSLVFDFSALQYISSAGLRVLLSAHKAMLKKGGMTVKNVWLKIVQGYENSKGQFGERFAYEEMRITCHEMQGGISEAEAYERFGKRCETAQYMKFGALLSQNMKKGSKGLSELLKLESIQALENRKSSAKLMGEEAGTKLLVPMFGMFAVVMLMVIVPAFLSIQI